ncbi:Immunoglobulin E-set [Penicillium griseofulvum]|uniref:Immunoglobulin E-set n=1 Tax=Penicillium patulum TaxID=5078 RepID=A0A135LJ46_PENPA|nr:Immunoglobulin E-set [Penicillium griseofulvum]KXG48992.1 Immunoglobulin E-set [Penicillium griseofulvum]
MGTFTFKWPGNASEVFVTGTFDDWGKTVKLDRVGDIFVKEVTISPIQKVHYKFVVDGIWTTDPNIREEEDGHNNVNNVLLPEEINSAPTMSGVTPDSTTAALAANVPKEPNGDLPGTFPETPGQESEQTLSVDPIPASGGYGNPVTLNPGDKVPHHSAIHNNTVDSTVTLDKESYEKGQTLPIDGLQNNDANTGASPYALPPITNNMIPESSLPMGGPAQRAASETEPTYTGGPAQQAALADPGYHIQSAGPDSTTAALAAAVPLEPKGKQTNGDKPVDEVPQVVKDSLAEAHKEPEAAANQKAVDEKKAIEEELHKKVHVEESAGAPAPTVTAATQPVAPLLTVGGVDSADVSPLSTPPLGRNFAASAPTSEPAPTSAPKATEPTEPTVTTGPETTSTAEVSAPKTEPAAPTVTTGVESTQAPATSTAETAGPTEPTGTESTQVPPASSKSAEQPRQSHSTEGASINGEKKKKHRLSSFFGKLKEKLK